MSAIIERVSTITEKGQTTVPKIVRDALGVSYGGKIAFRVDATGVSLHRADDEHDDPAIGAFLSFLAADMTNNPGAVAGLSPVLSARIAALVEGLDVDPNDAIDGDVAI